MSETILHSESVYEGRLLKVYRNTIQLADGRPALREVIKHPGAVALVAFDADENLLLVRQYRAGIDRAILEIPAGLLETGESAAACAARELREETGYQAGQLDSLGGCHVAPGYTDEYIHLFHAHDLTPAPLPQDDDEALELVRVPLAQALVWVADGTLSDSKTIIALLKVAAGR